MSHFFFLFINLLRFVSLKVPSGTCVLQDELTAQYTALDLRIVTSSVLCHTANEKCDSLALYFCWKLWQFCLRVGRRTSPSIRLPKIFLIYLTGQEALFLRGSLGGFHDVARVAEPRQEAHGLRAALSRAGHAVCIFLVVVGAAAAADVAVAGHLDKVLAPVWDLEICTVSHLLEEEKKKKRQECLPRRHGCR